MSKHLGHWGTDERGGKGADADHLLSQGKGSVGGGEFNLLKGKGIRGYWGDLPLRRKGERKGERVEINLVRGMGALRRGEHTSWAVMCFVCVVQCVCAAITVIGGVLRVLMVW